jgi:phosphoribosylformylglycinamidine synthase
MEANGQVKRVFVVKRPGFDIEAQGIAADLKENLGLTGLESVQIFNRYDVSGLSDEDFEKSITQVFSEAPVDDVYVETVDLSKADVVIAVEALPGQYDQRADSASQCIQIVTCGDKPLCRTARVFAFYGQITSEQIEQIRKWLINPVESREASLNKPITLEDQLDSPDDIKLVDGLIHAEDNMLEELRYNAGLAMSLEDLKFIRTYFNQERRDPSWTELRVLDTYWSDHKIVFYDLGLQDNEKQLVKKNIFYLILF